MKVLQNLYYVYKIPSNKINNLKTYSFKDASRDGCVVSIGDNLVFAKIREYYGETGDHISLYNKVQDIRKEMKNIKKQPTCQENIDKLKDLQHQLDKMLFIDDIVNIKVVTKKEYKQIARDGFDLNGKHYVRFMVGSGQMRRNTVSFINEELYDYMQEHLMCGLDKKIKNINLAKLSAYFALSFSSVLWVREPKVCVIKDFDTVIPNQKLNFIYKDDEGKNQVKEIYKDLKLNSCDGQGIISPEMAQNWAEDMHLNYVPCSFVVRTAFVKGNLVTFDFKEYARENGITKIKDRYGTEYNIDDINYTLKYEEDSEELKEISSRGTGLGNQIAPSQGKIIVNIAPGTFVDEGECIAPEKLFANVKSSEMIDALKKIYLFNHDCLLAYPNTSVLSYALENPELYNSQIKPVLNQIANVSKRKDRRNGGKEIMARINNIVPTNNSQTNNIISGLVNSAIKSFTNG